MQDPTSVSVSTEGVLCIEFQTGQMEIYVLLREREREEKNLIHSL